MIRALCVCALAGAVSTAGADTYQWTWNVGDPGGAINNAAGAFESVVATYSTTSQQFDWTVTFSNQVTDGLTLAVNDGPNPKGLEGELALLYIDGTSMASPKISAYGYNGRNDTTSYFDGTKQAAVDAPDVIRSSTDTAWINSVSIADVGSKRVFSFSLDASVINGHTPLYAAGGPWTGLQFDSKIGLWMHSFEHLSTSYDASGHLTSWQRCREGWFDGAGLDAQIIPLPGAAGLSLAGLGLVAVRRRR